MPSRNETFRADPATADLIDGWVEDQKKRGSLKPCKAAMYREAVKLYLERTEKKDEQYP
jgi:hypothetical protein